MKRVMIVDDEIIVRKGLESLMDWHAHGYAVVAEAESGDEALEKIPSVRPDIILTDLKMEPGDGFSLIRAIRSTWPDIRIIVLSSYNDFDNVRQAMKLGASDYIFKLTVTADELVNALDEVSSSLPAASDAEVGESRLEADLLEALHEDRCVEGQVNLPFDPDSGYRALVVHVDDFLLIRKQGTFPDWRRTRSLIRGLVGEAMQRLGSFLMLDYAQNDILVLIQPSDDDSAQLETACHILAHRASSIAGVPLSLTVSDRYKGQNSIIEALSHALDLRNCLFFFEGTVLCDEDDRPCTKNILPQTFSADERLKLASRADIGGLACMLSSLLDHFSCHHGYSRSEVESSLLDTVLVLSSVLEKAGLDEASLMQRMKDAISLSDRYSGLESRLRPLIADLSSTLEGHRPLRKEIAAIIDYVEANIARDISVAEAAAFLGMSESNFAHVFSDEMGISFTRCVNQMKMDLAARLLSSTDMRIGEVSQAVGSSNPNYFSVQFRKHFGLSPAEYRQKDRQQKN